MTPASRRAGRPLIAALLALLVAAPPAAAHGGALLGSAVTGPYRTRLTAQVLRDGAPGGGRAFDLTAYVADATSDADVRVRVRTTVWLDDGPVTRTARRIAGGYEAVVPVPDGAEVGRHPIVVEIAGDRGRGRLEIAPLEDGGPPGALLAGTAAALLALGTAAVVVRRRRDRGGAVPG